VTIFKIVSPHQGTLPLHLAAQEGHLEKVKHFVENKADVNARNIVDGVSDYIGLYY